MRSHSLKTESEARFCTDMRSHSLKTESEARICTDTGSHSLKTESEARFCTDVRSCILNELGLETKSKVALWSSLQTPKWLSTHKHK